MLLITFVLVFLSLFLYKKRCQQMSILKKLGYPGPKSNLIFGNAIELSKKGAYRVFPKWTKDYGPIVGFYIGGRPQILTSDLDLIRNILIKDFHLFTGRNQIIPGGSFPLPMFQKTVLFHTGNEWKQIRSIISPCFSILKLNAMEPLMMSSIDKMINELNEKAECGVEFIVEPMAKEVMFSVGTNCILGLDLSLQNGSKEVESFVKITRPQLENSILAITMLLFPSLTSIAYPLRLWWEKIRMQMLWSPEGVCIDVLRKCIEARKNFNTKCESVLQILMNCGRNRTTDDESLKMSEDNLKQFSLSEDEIVSNAIIMLVASSETTTTFLQFVIHNLITNVDIQEQLRTDLRNAVEKSGGRLDFKTLSGVPLLMNVIKETLRMYSPGAVGGNARVAEEDYEYKGYRIPKGIGLFVDIHSIHNDPNYWTEPEKFQPDRFDKNIDKLTFMPFGIG